MVFYSSPTIYDFLGFQQSDVVHQSVYDLIHMDDREMFRCQLHFALNPGDDDSDTRAENGKSGSKTSSSSMSLLPQYIPPENSSFLERSFCCRLRCLLDNTSGFLALNFTGRLKYLHLQGNTGANGTAAAPPQLALFAIATPVQPPSVMEIRTKTLIFQSKHRMDFAPVGIDTRGKLVLGYSEIELVTPGSGYQFIHAADMMYCADNHLKMIKTGDSGFTFFRLLTKTGHWLWVQATARIVFKGGRPDFIIARQKALTNEEGEEHLHQRRQQLPFNLATGEGVLYDSWMDAFSISGPPPPGAAEPTAEKALDPASLLGSLHRQDHSVYTQKPGPQLPIFAQMEELDVDQPQSSLEQAFLDSHALLSVPGQIQASQKRSLTEDLTSEAMMESLEQILGDIGDGGLEDLEVEETELRDWENTLVRMSKEREDASRELNHVLANDVFSYVEEALRRETGGLVRSPDQTGPPGSADSSSVQAQNARSVFSNDQQPIRNMTSGFREQTLFGDVLGSAGLSSSPVVPVHTHTLTHSPQVQTPQLWPPSSNDLHNPTISTQTWPPPVRDTGSVLQPDSDVRYVLNHSGSQQTCVGPQFQSPSPWQQQQHPPPPPQPQSFQHHTPTHSSHTPGGVNPTTAPSFRPQTQRVSGSCMYEKRDGRMPNAAAGVAVVPARQNGPTHTNSPFISQAMLQSNSTDVGNISLVHMSGDDAGLGTVQTGYPQENGSLQSSFFCWNGDAQISNVPLNSVVDPFSFPPLPTGSINLSQNSGP